MVPAALPLVALTVTFDPPVSRLATRTVGVTLPRPLLRVFGWPSARSARRLEPLAPLIVPVTARLLLASLQVTETVVRVAPEVGTDVAAGLVTGSALTSGADVAGPGVSGCGGSPL